MPFVLLLLLLLTVSQFPRNSPAIFRNWIRPPQTATPPPPLCLPRVPFTNTLNHLQSWCLQGDRGCRFFDKMVSSTREFTVHLVLYDSNTPILLMMLRTISFAG